MSEIREHFKPLLNKRVTIRGTLAKWEDEWYRDGRQVGRACITFPELAYEVLCQHVWVIDVRHWRREPVGIQISFDAVVQKYANRCGQTNYCLGNAGKLTVIHPPAIAIPDPTLTSVEAVRQITAWAATSGGVAVVEKVLDTMPPMPVPDVLNVLRSMKK